MKRNVILLGLVFGLCACGGGGGGGGNGSGSGIDPRLARLDIYEAQKLRVLGDPGAGVVGMPMTTPEFTPDSGAFTFEGSTSIRVERDLAPLVLFGDAGVQLDFDSGAATGRIENVFGTNSQNRVVDYEGVIDVTGGAPARTMDLTYQGSLNTPGDVLAFDGTMTGVLLGNPVAALSAADLEALVDQNGVVQTATVVITVEQVTPP